MRVIHHDGRVGTRSPVRVANSTWVDFDDEPGEWVTSRDLRPLGPIEEELRCKPVVDWREALELWENCLDSLGIGPGGGIVSAIDTAQAESEAIEACARVYEQHGEAL